MAKQIYRKALLERMSSPEQLDKMIVITPPAFWLALLGGAAIVTVTLVWSILGHLPIKLETSGIFVSDQMAFTLASDTAGIVSTLEVEIGEHVEEGDVLLSLVDEAVQRELSALLERRAGVEAVTLTSVNDEVTADNRDLINLKAQLDAAGSESDQNRAMLDVYKSELEALQPQVSAAQAEMETAREKYYAYIQSNTNSKIEIEFSEAQSNYNQQVSLLAQAEASCSNARTSYLNSVQALKDITLANVNAALTLENQNLTAATAVWQPLENERIRLEGELKELEEALAALSPDMEDYTKKQEEIKMVTADIANNKTMLDSARVPVDAAEAMVKELSSLKSTADSISSGSTPGSFDSLLNAGFLDSGSYSQLQSLYSQYQAANVVYNNTKSTLSVAEQGYKIAKEAYTAYADGRAKIDAEKERLGTLYNQLNSDYNALYSQQSNLKANITSIEGQLRASDIGSEVQRSGYVEQFEATRSALLDGLDAEIEKYQYNLKKYNIRATVSGNVTDIKVGVGAAVGQGTEIVTIRQLSEEDHIICYMPISSGKKVEPGMEVIVCPTTVNRQEYGHMKAEVVLVDDYVTPASSIRATLGDDMLVQAFTQNGPVVAVTCRLYTDETTASGYWWSNRKGADLIVPEGTMVTADIVTEKKSPITMLIPYIKEKLTMAVEPGGSKEVQ